MRPGMLADAQKGIVLDSCDVARPGLKGFTGQVDRPRDAHFAVQPLGPFEKTRRIFRLRLDVIAQNDRSLHHLNW